MDNAVGDGNVSTAEIGPSLFLKPGQQFEPDLTVAFVVLVDAADHRCERLDQIGTANHADEFAVLDDRDALDAVTLEQRSDFRERGVLRDRSGARSHDLAHFLAVRLGKFCGERAGTGYRFQPPWPPLLGSDLDAMD